MADTTGAQSGITVKGYEPITGDKVAAALPGPLGSGVKTFQDIASTTSDGSLSGSDIGTLASDGASFVSSCMDVAGIASDPIGWLVGQGLNFLMTVVQPLQDLVHLVTGDGPRLANAAGNFNAIGAGVAKFGVQFAEDSKKAFATWDGQAADAAATKLGKFARGIDGVAAQAGDIAQFLQISSMIMSVIEEFIKAILTELITWLVMIWIPALAAAVPTFGASTAEAGVATGVKGAQSAGKATKQISKLQKLLDKIKDFIAKMKTWIQDARKLLKEDGPGFVKNADAALKREQFKPGGASWGAKLDSAGGMVGKRLKADSKNVQKSFGDQIQETAQKAAFGTVGLGKGSFVDGKWVIDAGKEGQTVLNAAGKAAKYSGGAAKADEYDDTGNDDSDEETSDNLGF